MIRQEARLAVSKTRPVLGADDTVYVYIEKYPTISEFEATWRIWVQDNSGMGEYVLGAMQSLLPGFKAQGSHYVTSDFKSERTVVKSEAEEQLEQLVAEGAEQKKTFQGLQKGVESRLSSVRDGVDGRDGKDGAPGAPGRDGTNGKDLEATEVELFDLKDVEPSLEMEPGQVLTWDGSKWTNLYTRQSTFLSGGGRGDEEGGGEPAGPGKITVQERAGADGAPENPVVDVTKLSFNTNNGFSVTDLGEGEALVNLGSAFAPWLVDGQQTLAPEGEEPVEFIAGPGIEITTNPNTYPQQIKITSTGGGGEGGGSGGGNCDGILDGGNADNGGSNGVFCPDPGIEEAPEDGQQYARQDGAWEVVEVIIEVEEAPEDGQQYARQDGSWSVIEPIDIDVQEAPMDGQFYVRQNGTWIDLRLALEALGVVVDESIDGGDFSTGYTTAGSNTVADGGNLTTGQGEAANNLSLDGGNFTTGQTGADDFAGFSL